MRRKLTAHEEHPVNSVARGRAQSPRSGGTPATRRPSPLTRWRHSTKSSGARSASMRPTRPCAASCGTPCWSPGSRRIPRCSSAWCGPAGMGGSAWRKRRSRGALGSRPRPASSGRHGKRRSKRSVATSRSPRSQRKSARRIIRWPIVLSSWAAALTPVSTPIRNRARLYIHNCRGPSQNECRPGKEGKRTARSSNCKQGDNFRTGFAR